MALPELQSLVNRSLEGNATEVGAIWGEMGWGGDLLG